MMELSEIESPIKEHRVAPSDSDTAYAASTSASPSSSSLASKPNEWWAFIKANVPSILSILSVLTNVIILSALIPSMKQDIAYMQGRVDTWGDKFKAADEAINTFNLRMNSINSTITDATQLAVSAKQEASDAQQAAAASLLTALQQAVALNVSVADIVNKFEAEKASMVVTITQANNVSSHLNAQASAAISSISTYNDTVINQLDTLLLQQQQQADASKQVLAEFNSSLIHQLQSVATNAMTQTVNVSNQIIQEFMQANATYFSGVNSIQSQLQQFHTVQTYTPTIDGCGSNLGSPPPDVTVHVGGWVQLGNVVMYHFRIQGDMYGSPSGSVCVSLPVAPDQTLWQVGTVASVTIGSTANLDRYWGNARGTKSVLYPLQQAIPSAADTWVAGSFHLIGSVAYIAASP